MVGTAQLSVTYMQTSHEEDLRNHRVHRRSENCLFQYFVIFQIHLKIDFFFSINLHRTRLSDKYV